MLFSLLLLYLLLSVWYLLIIVDPTYFPSRSADIYLRQDGEVKVIGSFGILHPEVLEKFDLNFPTSAMEFDLEPFL